MPISESIPASILVLQAAEITVPPFITSQPLESIPSPSPVAPFTKILSVPPFIQVTDTSSSLVLIPSLPDSIFIFPPLIVKCNSESKPSFSATIFKIPFPFSPPFIFNVRFE